MMGKKKLGAVKAEIQEAFAQAGLEAEEWFQQQLRKLERTPRADPKEIQNLLLLRDALAKAAQTPARFSQGRARTRSS